MKLVYGFKLWNKGVVVSNWYLLFYYNNKISIGKECAWRADFVSYVHTFQQRRCGGDAYGAFRFLWGLHRKS